MKYIKYLFTCIGFIFLFVSSVYAGLQGTGPIVSSGSSTSFILTAPTVNSGGSCELAVLFRGNYSGGFTGSGWTVVPNYPCGAGSNYTTILTKAASGTEGGTYTFNTAISSSISFGQIAAFCGVKTTSPIDQSPACVTSSYTPTSITPTAADEDGITWYGNINGGPSAWPTGPEEVSVDSSGVGFAYGTIIGNASAQQYTMTAASGINSSSYAGSLFFNMMTNNRAWGIRSTSAGGTAGTPFTINAPINIGTTREQIDLFFVILNNNGTVTPPTHWTCPGKQVFSDNSWTLFHCIDSAPSSSDTVYSFSYTGGGGNGGDLVDEINTTGMDTEVSAATAGSNNSSTGTLTTASNNEPIISSWWQENSGQHVSIPSSVTTGIAPPANNSGGSLCVSTCGNVFETQPTAGTSTSRTVGCLSTCSSNPWGNFAVANAVSTPVPAAPQNGLTVIGQ